MMYDLIRAQSIGARHPGGDRSTPTLLLRIIQPSKYQAPPIREDVPSFLLTITVNSDGRMEAL